MKIKTFEVLSPEHQKMVENNMIAKAVPLFMEGASTTLIHRKVSNMTGYSRNLVEHVLRNHENFKTLVKERWNQRIKYNRSKCFNVESQCQE